MPKYITPSTPHFIRFAGAIDTEWCRRIELQSLEGDVFLTTQAIPVVTGLYTPQCSRDFLQFDLTASIPFPRHRLTLQGIHSRQAPDTGLIELDSCCRLISRFLQNEQRLPRL